MSVTGLPSPNHDSREGHAVDMLVLHYTGMRTAQEALDRLRDPQAKVSAHYVVDEEGMIYRLVEESERAWHAGVSSWRGHTNINQRSIGIELVNPGHEFGYRPFPQAQMEAVAELCKDILSRHAIPARNIVGHSDIAPQRKEDPGELFDWKGLAERGIGLWPEEQYPNQVKGKWNIFAYCCWIALLAWVPMTIRSLSKDNVAVRPLPPYAEIQQKLAEYGYDCPQTGELDEPTRKTILAFQRHFFPQRLTGTWDHQCAVLLESLLWMV